MNLCGRKACIEQIDALEVDHVLVGELFQPAQAAQFGKTHCRQARGLDMAHVPARALDADDFDFLAEKIARLRLHAGVAATVQHEFRIGAQKPRRVGTQGEIAIDALRRVTRNERFGIGIGPA
jgi:hypothetical protein